MTKREKKKLFKFIVAVIILILLFITGYFNEDIENFIKEYKVYDEESTPVISYETDDIPEYDGKSAYVLLDNNIPEFTEQDYKTESFEIYSDLDDLGRCGVAYANICKEIMPKVGEERGDINCIKPSGWKQAKYKGEYLYNRCHLIGWQLAGENANEKNLITGTRYMNVEGMLPFENKVADYFDVIVNENNHVLYRVTPVYQGNNLVASGVKMEAYSVEDNGEGVSFNVYVYNVQKGIEIDYLIGNSFEK